MDELPFEVFEHTADVGLQVYGRTLPELFIHAAEGMESLMVPLEQVEPRVSREVEVEGDDLVSLLIAWLSRLIFLFDTEFLLFRQFEIEDFSETQLKMKAHASGEPYDEQRHELSSAIKAVTRHQAEVVPTAHGYQARIIFDI
ncbi:archease [Thermogemmatispora onikobensis]|uniref:archease n=1 Tax=Thermogemmatispora onikobensis TaxID=732234 RepID=UPI0008532A0E|nr:archease [Thermogemmatispora onikobensis]